MIMVSEQSTPVKCKRCEKELKKKKDQFDWEGLNNDQEDLSFFCRDCYLYIVDNWEELESDFKN